MLITTKLHLPLCSHTHGSNSVVVLLCHDKNDNEYSEDIEIDIHIPSNKGMHKQSKCAIQMVECIEEHVKFNSAKDEEGC